MAGLLDKRNLFVLRVLPVMQKTVRNVDEDIFEKAKRIAEKKGLRMGDAVNEALMDWISSQEEPELSITEFEPLESGSESLSENYREEIYG